MLTDILHNNNSKSNDIKIKTEIFEAEDFETPFEINEICKEGTGNKGKLLKFDQYECNDSNYDVKIKSETCDTSYFYPPTEFKTEEISNGTEIHKVFIKIEDKVDYYIKNEIDEEFIIKEENEQEDFSRIHNVVQEPFCNQNDLFNQNQRGNSVANKNDSKAAGSMCTYNHDPLQNMETVKCKKCPKTYHNKEDLKIHYRLHTSTSTYSKSHEFVHEKSHVCDVCQKSFNRIDILKRHKLTHGGIHPYKCDACQRTFSQMCHLKIHKLVHTGEKPHVCDVCQKAFRMMCSLQAHKRIHSGEKPYKCDVCKTTFRQVTHLKSHKLVHSNDKPFTCDICQKAFGRKDYLRKHKLLHSKEAVKRV